MDLMLEDEDLNTPLLREYVSLLVNSEDGDYERLKQLLSQNLDDDRKIDCKQAIKLFVPHLGLIMALLSYLATGALIFIWIECDNEMRVRGEKRDNVTRLRQAIVDTVVETCGSQGNGAVTRQMVGYGYERVSPRTDQGRIFTVCFGLFGIPLLFITAADIGKFMSEMVTKTYAWAVTKYRKIRRARWEVKRKRLEEEAKANNLNGANGYIQVAPLPPPIDDPVDEDEEIQMPFWAYFGLILGYCAGGSVMLNTIEDGLMWNFIYGFFFGFNAITTIGVGDINGRNIGYMSLIVAYVIIGLAVITMCIDLASSQVKMLFTKLHYFGRQFRGARLALSGEIQEALSLIAAMKYKNDVTLDDIITFLTVQEKLNRRPYIPRNVYFLKWIEDEANSVAKYGDGTRSSSIDGTAGFPDLGVPSHLSFHYGVLHGNTEMAGVHTGLQHKLNHIDDDMAHFDDIDA